MIDCGSGTLMELGKFDRISPLPHLDSAEWPVSLFRSTCPVDVHTIGDANEAKSVTGTESVVQSEGEQLVPESNNHDINLNVADRESEVNAYIPKDKAAGEVSYDSTTLSWENCRNDFGVCGNEESGTEPNQERLRKLVIDFINTYGATQGKEAKTIALEANGTRVSITELFEFLKPNPIGYLSFYVVHGASKLLNRRWSMSTHGYSCYMFSPFLMLKAVEHQNSSVFHLNKVAFLRYAAGITQELIESGFEDVDLNSKVFYLPCCVKDHWFCYAFYPGEGIIALLDSAFALKDTFHHSLKFIVVEAFGIVMDGISPQWVELVNNLRYVDADIPRAHKQYDSGCYMLMAIHLWSPTFRTEKKSFRHTSTSIRLSLYWSFCSLIQLMSAWKNFSPLLRMFVCN